MKIAIDAHAIGSRQTGNETYISNLLEALGRIDIKNQYLILFTEESAQNRWSGRFENFSTLLLPKNPVKRHLLEIPAAIRKFNADLLHVQYAAPPLCPVPFISTIHDISHEHFPEHFRAKDALRARLTIRMAAKNADHILTVSKYSKEDIVRTYNVPECRVSVTYNGVSSVYRQVKNEKELSRVKSAHGIDKPYILSVGNLQPRKNIPNLLKSFEELVIQNPDIPHRLVIVGKRAHLYDSIFSQIEKSETKNRIILTDYVPTEDLPALYSGADCFVYPSTFEGFGLPPLEAMACGTPVLAGNNSSIPEVVGEAGVLVDVTRTDEIVSGLKQIILDPARQESLSAAGLERARQFTWAECARKTLAVYNATVSTLDA